MATIVGILTENTATAPATTIYSSLIDAGSSGNLKLQAEASTAQVQFATQNTNRWIVREAGDLEPAADNAYNVGSATANAIGVFTFKIGSGSSTALSVITNNTARWSFGASTGHFVPASDNAFNIGSSSADISALFVRQLGTGASNSLSININSAQVWAFDTSGNFLPSANNTRTVGDATHNTNSVYTYQLGTGDSSFDLTFFTNATNRWSIGKTTGHFVPASDNAFNIGSSSNAVSALYTRQIGTGGANELDFFTNGTSRWAMGGSGNFQPFTDNAVNLGATSSHMAATYTYVLATGNSSDLIIQTNATTRWRFRAAGTLNPNGNNTYDLGETANRIATIYAVNALNTSDQRIKTDIVTLDNSDALDKVNSLNPIRYKFISEYDTTDRFRTGFKAQEVISLLPEAVVAGDSDLSKNYGDEGFETWSMQSDHIIPYLAAAIKELKSQNDALAARIVALGG